jgi:hypothetical protein
MKVSSRHKNVRNLFAIGKQDGAGDWGEIALEAKKP